MTNFTFPASSTSGDVALPPPPTFDAKRMDTSTYLSQVSTYLGQIFLASQDLNSAIQSGWLIHDARIVNLSVVKLLANTIFTQLLYVGSSQQIQLDGVNQDILIKDAQATPKTRVIIGKLGVGTTQWGIQVMDSAGTVRFQSSDSVFIDGGVIQNATIVNAAIVNGTITGTKITTTDGSAVATGNINSNAVSGFGQTSWSGVNIHSSTDITLGTVTITVNSTTDGVIITTTGYAAITLTAAASVLVQVDLKRGATVLATQFIRTISGTSGTIDYPFTLSYTDTGVSGSQSYSLAANDGNLGSVSVALAYGQIQAMDVKR